ncbi:carbohydrate-binding module family 13 protein [Phycomyces blakesleeanus]|uniref:Carbohydrate-binding module family 13 protein n=2 Tax=Phycomyces blakesleeanus TaxID=4837 RepID=A0A163AAQ6_PHYB8|nr:carbohydrate-binding module family 13 protein [Phycomyces blakesleeanus NRRL 1555(-)]OAD72201.1 carbohydrate-binding module family 13 protein [Phycomyces blakesleeanus NRRL 1555(-)]|eukprot:XP_018290241.1 carbohydrate-binding module family 13 protein [Phycomyces blakesleeanus NRRL 1555(-)]
MTAGESAFPIGYFFIISKLNNLVIDVENPTEAGPGARIIMKERQAKSPERDSQLWIHQNGFLTNKMTGLVLDINRSPSFMAIFNGENHLYLDQMKEEDTAHDQRFAFEEETGFIYSLHNENIVFDIRKAEVAEGGRVIVYKRKGISEDSSKKPLHQYWSVELGDPPKIDEDDEEEDESKRARLRSWFGNWSGWDKRKNGMLVEHDLEEAHEKVYTEKKASLSHELLAGAAAFAAVHAWEKRQEEAGEEVHHSMTKKLLASLAAAEMVKLYEERGIEEEDDDEEKKIEKKNILQRMSASAAQNLFEAKHGRV